MRRLTPFLFLLTLFVCLLVPALALAEKRGAGEFDFGQNKAAVDDGFDAFLKYLYIMAFVSAGFGVFIVVCNWVVFTKAGEPGWASIVPFYNAIVLLRIVEKPILWFILLFIPLVNIVAIFWWAFAVPFALAEKFGKGGGFALGLIFLPIIFYPILAFGSAQYQGKSSDGRRSSRDADEDDDDRPQRRLRRGN